MINLPTYKQALLQMSAYRRIRDQVNIVLSKFEINATQWAILGLILEEPNNLRITDIAERLAVEGTLITVLARELVDKDLVSSKPHQQDRRAKVLGLTPRGEASIIKLEPELAKALATIEAQAQSSDWEAYFRILEAISSPEQPDS